MGSRTRVEQYQKLYPRLQYGVDYDHSITFYDAQLIMQARSEFCTLNKSLLVKRVGKCVL